jgi:hypothetical protein
MQTDSREHDQGYQNQEFVIPTTGNLDPKDFKNEFKEVDTPHWNEKAKNLAFAEELVLVEIPEENNPYAEQVIELSVQGVNQFMIRGKPQWIKRKFLEVLIGAKVGTISTPEILDPSGNKTTKIVVMNGSKYPYRILQDNNPNGMEWAKRVMQEA